jgi:hypothetical protein
VATIKRRRESLEAEAEFERSVLHNDKEQGGDLSTSGRSGPA